MYISAYHIKQMNSWLDLAKKIIVFSYVAAWIQSDISGCQQDFFVVWRWNQLRTFWGTFEDIFTDFWEAVSLEKIFEIVQENTLECSNLISFLGNKKSIKFDCTLAFKEWYY